MTVVQSFYNLRYLPLPNRVDMVRSDLLAPFDLTTTVFGVLMADDGSVMLAHNIRRGVELAGGHVEPGETVEQALRRECLEEAGCEIEDIRPLGYLRMSVQGPKPEGYLYPYPLSFQQFFTARITRAGLHTAIDECHVPQVLPAHDLGLHLSDSVQSWIKMARAR